MITSTDFLKSIIPIAEKDHFLSTFSQRLFIWIKEYYEQYGQAPNRHIQDIVNTKKARIKNEDAELIELFLVNLNRHFEEGFNEEYYADKAIQYLEKRALIVHAEKILSLTTLGQIEEAKKVQTDYKKIAKTFGAAVNPLDPTFIESVFNKQDGDNLFRFPGVLGDLFGWFCRGHFVIVQGPYKIGKSYTFQLFREIGMLNNLRVLDINLEMSERQLALRMFKGMTGLTEEEDEILNVSWPVFDCLHNQIGSCPYPERTTGNGIKLYTLGDLKPTPNISPPKGYKICDVCRNKNEWKKDFVEDIWYETIENSEYVNPAIVKRKGAAIQRQYGDLIRFKCFPRGSANVDDIRRLLDMLEYTEGFIPDVINVDYAKIMAPEYDAKAFNEEGQLDKTMVALAGLADERHCLVTTASQINKEAIKRGKARMGDASQSTRAIYAHAALVIGISQTDEEEAFNAKRFNVIVSRFKQFNTSLEVRVLQQLSVGQPYVDSEYARANWGKNDKKSKRREELDEE
jgi:hypothetical protein